MIVLGVDPGTIRTGWAVVRRDGSRLLRLGSGTLRTDEKSPMEQRLLTVAEGLEQVVTLYGPNQAAVEDIFFSHNARSALKLGQVRGAILVTMARRGLGVASYPPALVKRSIVGTGRADKNQVSRIVQAILSFSGPLTEDEGDALAIAICHLNAPPILTTDPRSLRRK
ncbi:MAG: crossover junction endodeoxyribonuclease RuvC [Myxococcota bacterium]|jgi:crossover junction endodeoxyribonuclease RuvC|nr:crossover junction endodeoxyribonuclease RuvC [Myxococcota bacterium]